jgi:hypothetical protein
VNRLIAVLAALAAFSPATTLADAIQDNSFLIEEAYNQEPGVIQHISTFARTRGGAWGYSFTEEWPVLGQTHQASVTFTALGPEKASAGIGDLALNYRYQAYGSGETRVAFAPRLTALLPTGDEKRGLGAGGAGLQVNLPVSVVLLDDALVTHVNVGGTYVPSARDSTGERGSATTFAAGPSLIWLAHSNFNVMLEALYTTTEVSLPSGSQRTETFTVNPGVRGAINFASGLQIVPGLAVPIGVGPSRGERSIFFYLSFEHPFRLAGPTEKEKAL